MEFLIKTIKKILNILSDICYLLIIVYAAVSIPALFKYTPIIVLSGSMEPTYHVGSIIYYHPVKNEAELKKGDVITYKISDDTLVTHRIYEIDDGKYETKGDANDTPDVLKIDYNQIVGKVSKISIPYIGYYVDFIHSNVIIIIAIILILILEMIFGGTKVVEEKIINEELEETVPKKEKKVTVKKNENKKSNNKK